MAVRKPDGIIDLHRSTRAEILLNRNDAFEDGVCHAIDELRALGFYEAADALFAKLFVPRPAPREKS